MPWDDSYPETEDEPVKPVDPTKFGLTVGHLRAASVQALPGLEPLIFDEEGNRLVLRQVGIESQHGKARLVMQVRIQQPAMTTTPTTPTTKENHAAS